MTTQLQESADQERNRVRFDTREEYILYFSFLKRVLNLLLSWYDNQQEGDKEREVVKKFVTRVLATVQALGMKYSYNPSHSLAIDLNDSGYPHAVGIMELENDARGRDEKLQTLPPKGLLVDQMVNRMLQKMEEPSEELWQASSRVYYEMLNQEEIIFPFCHGGFDLLEESSKMRRYFFSWLCYDFETSMPYVHIMVFDQDKTEEPINQEGVKQMMFLDVIKSFGSRVPESMSLLAADIDGALPSIHPKILKRIRFGPILSKRYSLDSKEAHPLLRYLQEYGSDDQFIMILRVETLMSRGQTETPTGIFKLGTAKIREIFAIDQTDEECFQARTTSIRRHIFIPHYLTQHINLTEPELKRYAKAELITYNKEGKLT